MTVTGYTAESVPTQTNAFTSLWVRIDELAHCIQVRIYLAVYRISRLQVYSETNYVQIQRTYMSGQERLRYRLKNKFNRLFHSFCPGRRRSPSLTPNHLTASGPSSLVNSDMVRCIVHSRLVIFLIAFKKSNELTKYNAVITTLGAQVSYRRAIFPGYPGILGSDSYRFSTRSRAGTLPYSYQSFLKMSWNPGYEFRESWFCPFPVYGT